MILFNRFLFDTWKFTIERGLEFALDIDSDIKLDILMRFEFEIEFACDSDSEIDLKVAFPSEFELEIEVDLAVGIPYHTLSG